MLLLVAAVVLARASWIGPALGALGTLLVVHLLLLGTAGVIAAGAAGIALLAAGELAQWSIDARLRGRYDDRIHLARAGGIAVLTLRGIAVVLVGSVAAVLPITGGIELALVATTAAVALFGLTAVAGRRASAPGADPADDRGGVFS